MRRIKDSGVHVCDLLGRSHQLSRKRCLLPLDAIQKRYSAARPNRPVSKQAADDPRSFAPKIEFGQKVYNNVVVIPGIERDLATSTALCNGAHHIQCLISIEWRNLDRDNLGNLSELAPELIR